MNLVPRKFFLDDFFDDFTPDVKTKDMKCDIYEKDGKYFIEMDIPGFEKKDINIDFDNGYLTISASHEEEKDDSDKNYIRKERSYGSYQRQFYLGEVDDDSIKAEFNNGILKVSVLKKEEINTKKKIQID